MTSTASRTISERPNTIDVDVNGWYCIIRFGTDDRSRTVSASISRSEISCDGDIHLESYHCPYSWQEAKEHLVYLASRYFVNSSDCHYPQRCRIGERLIPLHLLHHTSTTDYSLGAWDDYADVIYPRYELNLRSSVFSSSFFNLLETYAYADDTLEQRLHQRLMYAGYSHIPTYTDIPSVYNALIEIGLNADEFAVLNKLIDEYQILTRKEYSLNGVDNVSIKEALKLSGYDREKLIEIRDVYLADKGTEDYVDYQEVLQDSLFEDGFHIFIDQPNTDA